MEGSNGKARRKVRTIVIICIVAVVVVAAGVYLLIMLSNYKKGVDAIQVRNVDISAIEDGEYFGDSDVGLVSAKVRVVVEKGVITEIDLLEHKNGRGGPAEVIPGRIVEQQQIDVDIITGATSSSKVIKEAVYNALTGR